MYVYISFKEVFRRFVPIFKVTLIQSSVSVSACSTLPFLTFELKNGESPMVPRLFVPRKLFLSSKNGLIECSWYLEDSMNSFIVCINGGHLWRQFIRLKIKMPPSTQASCGLLKQWPWWTGKCFKSLIHSTASLKPTPARTVMENKARESTFK